MNSKESTSSEIHLNPDLLPDHIAVIMDGNGRWAKKRLMNRVKGHEKGADTVRMVVRTCREVGIKYLTLYAFSTENWQRPKVEVTALMTLLKRFLTKERDEMVRNNIQLRAIGELDMLPDGVRSELEKTISLTKSNTAMTLTLALSYGGRTELLNSMRSIAQAVSDDKLVPSDITESLISNTLYNADVPDPDLMIRTSGELRISNFLLWQLAYAELCFSNTLWPDFSKEELISIIADFQNRDRRFGQVEP